MDFPKAGFFRRFTAFAVDIVILDFLGTLITYPLTSKFDFSTDDILSPLLTGGGFSEALILFFLLYISLKTLLWGFYFTFFTGWDGQTPGKRIMSLRVDSIDNRPMNYHIAFTRFTGYSLSASFFMIGFIWMLFDSNNQTWHDKIAQTVVVRI